MGIKTHGNYIEIEEAANALILRDILHFGFCCYSWNDAGELTTHTQDMTCGAESSGEGE